MNKQIEEKAEIKKIISDICPFYKEYGSCDKCNKELDTDDPPCYWECMAQEIVRNHYRKQSEGEWISVEDRLPPAFVSVLVYMPQETPCPTVREGYVSTHGEWCAGGFLRQPDEVVMWREMPEEPKMKGETK